MKSETLLLRISPEDKQRLRELAEVSRRSLGDMVCFLVHEAWRKQVKEKSTRG